MSAKPLLRGWGGEAEHLQSSARRGSRTQPRYAGGPAPETVPRQPSPSSMNINIPQTHYLVQAPLHLATGEETEDQESALSHQGNQRHEGQG